MIHKLLNEGVTNKEIIEIISLDAGMAYLEWLFKKVNFLYECCQYDSYKDCFLKNLNDDNYYSYKAWMERHNAWLKRHPELANYDHRKIDFIINIFECEKDYWDIFNFLLDDEIQKKRECFCSQCKRYDKNNITQSCQKCKTYLEIIKQAKLNIANLNIKTPLR